MPRRALYIALVLATAVPIAAAADPPGAGTFSITFENDTFQNTDHYYTSGQRLAWSSADEPPDWLAALGRRAAAPLMPEAPIRWSAALGQSIYTARRVSSRSPPRDDRPFAGWLYLSFGLAAVAPRDLLAAELSLGVIGPASLADQTQSLVHTLIGVGDVDGWNRQIGLRPAGLLSLERRWALRTELAPGLEVDLVPALGANLGNVQTAAAAGLLARIGHDLSIDFGPARLRPALSGIGVFRPPESWSLYAFVGAEGRAIAWDATLDGNDEGYWRIDREPFVLELSAGAGVAYRALRLSFTSIVQSATFDEQSDKPFAFGSMQLSIAF
jgi:hypothetical protein